MSGSATVTVASDFNSRPSARGNSDGGGLRIPHQNFNSRPSARGDRRKGYEELFRFISIHAPPRGATRRTHNAGSPRLFQFTPLREGRRVPRASAVEIHAVFQFTLLREGRQAFKSSREGNNIFQFTPLREGRLPLVSLFPLKNLFQFTPLREGRRIDLITSAKR